jgi:ABC-2 type transport system permease protein
MTSIDTTSAAAPRMLTTLPTFYRLLLRTQLSLARVLGIGALGVLTVLLGVLAGQNDDPSQAAGDVATFALGLVVPLATLWLGTSALGDLVEDRLLVYVWLKPVPRWQLPAAAVLATTTLVIPLTAVPVGAEALVAGADEIALEAFIAATLAGFAYAGVFVAAGLWFKRAAWWGLAFVLLWENAAAYLAEGLTRYTIVGWAGSILDSAPGSVSEVSAGRAGVAYVVLPALAIAGWLVATWRYRKGELD